MKLYTNRAIAKRTIIYRGNYLPATIQIMFLIHICAIINHSYSISKHLNANVNSSSHLVINNMLSRIVPGKLYICNCEFTIHGINLLFTLTVLAWLCALILRAGDVHPNPGPSSNSSSTSLNTSIASSSNINFLNLANHLSFVHYNVQSLAPKLDILATELMDFDILAFSETWLSPTTKSDDLMIDSFSKPERKDRVGDSHGGVILYVKDFIFYKRRADLELRGIENIWIEIVIKHKHILFGLFYRPPSSDSVYFSTVEDSIHLAIDTGISDIIVTGDFNYNILNTQSSRKITSCCEQFSLTQMINEPTHYTETSSSLIDLVLVSNKAHVISSGVGDPFLCQEIRYHCPVFGILNFSKPKRKSFTRHIWRYDQGNYNLLREKISNADWLALQNDDINAYAKSLIEQLLDLAGTCIPNKVVTIRPGDPPWITSRIKLLIRKRKRAYRKARRTDNPSD